MVKEARDQLLSNETQEELRQVLEGSCNLIPIGFVSEMCRKAIDEFIPDLIDILVSSLDPDQVCSVAGLCNPDFMTRQSLTNKLQQALVLSNFQSRILLPVTIPSSTPSLKKGSTCSECKTAMKYSKKLFNRLSEAELSAVVLKVCQERLGRNSSECTALANVFLPPLFKYLQGMSTDQFCGYLKHCKSLGIQEHKVKPFTGKEDLTCDFCKQLVEHLRQIMASNTTEEELKQAFLNFCEELGPAAEECQNLLEQYFDMVYSYLLEALDPDSMCSTLGLCPSMVQKMDKVLIKLFPALQQQKVHLLKLKYHKKAGGYQKSTVYIPLVKVFPSLPRKYLYGNKSDMTVPMVSLISPLNVTSLDTSASQPSSTLRDVDCEMCQAIVTYVYDELKDKKTKDDIEIVLKYVCDIFPGDSKQKCLTMVDTYINLLVELIRQELTPKEICAMLKFCPSSKASVPVSRNPVKEASSKTPTDEECTLCQTVVQFVYDQLKDDKTEAAIKQALDTVCNLFPTKTKDKCVNMVNTYFEILISLILQDFTPDEICRTVGLCPSAKTPPLAHLSFGNGVPIKNPTDTECDICQNVVQYVYNELKDSKTEAEIKQALDQACSLLPTQEQQKCVDLINQYFDLLISLIIQDMTPSQVCETLGLCSSLNVTSTASPPPASQVPSITTSEAECNFCQNVVQFVYNELKDEKTEDAIKRSLSQVCRLFPEADRQKCSNMVNTYFDLLVSLIIQDATPLQICQTLGLCASSPQGNLECTFCNYALHFIQNQLVDNVTEARVEEILSKLCNSLPKEVADECNAFVEEYGPAMMVLLAQEIDPSIVCVAIKACPKGGLEKHSEVSLVNHKLSECETCTMVVDYLERVLHNTKNDQEISKAMAGVCDIVPRSIQSDCNALIQAYGPYLLSALGDLGDSHKVCKNVDLCSKATPPPILLGSDYCTFGPSYWCKSTKHAASCNAHEYCKKKVWKQ